MVDLINHHDEMVDMADRINGIINMAENSEETKEERFSEKIKETNMMEIPKETREVEEKPKKKKRTFFDLDKDTQKEIVQKLDKIFKSGDKRDRMGEIRSLMVRYNLNKFGEQAIKILNRYDYLLDDKSNENNEILGDKESDD